MMNRTVTDGSIEGNEGKNAEFTQSTGHSASFDINMPDTSECKDADLVEGTGDSAPTVSVKTKGTDPMDGLVASMKKLRISTMLDTCIPSKWEERAREKWVDGLEAVVEDREGRGKASSKATLEKRDGSVLRGLETSGSGGAGPVKHKMYMGTDAMWERYLENIGLLGDTWVRKVRHIACMTLRLPTGPVWPTYIEPLALELFDFLRRVSVDWTRVPDNADFLNEIDFVWRVNPQWLPPDQLRFIPIWEYVTGMARTWDWNWHNEARKRGAPEKVWRQEERRPRSRFHQNSSSAARHHHILRDLRVPTIANWVRTNKFYRVGDDETACERPESSPGCRYRCRHTEYACTLRKLKLKHGLIRAPGVEPENEHGGIE